MKICHARLNLILESLRLHFRSKLTFFCAMYDYITLAKLWHTLSLVELVMPLGLGYINIPCLGLGSKSQVQVLLLRVQEKDFYAPPPPPKKKKKILKAPNFMYVYLVFYIDKVSKFHDFIFQSHMA